MAEGARLLTVGTISGGSGAVEADMRPPFGGAVAVLLSTDYAMLDPPGFPSRPSFTGAATPQYPQTITSGTTITVSQAEANALVAAGAATLA